MQMLCRTAVAAAFATVACFAPVSASYADGFAAIGDDSPTFMLYARKSFGPASDPSTLPYLSFRVEKAILPGPDSLELSFHEYRTMPLAEFRLTAGDRRSIYLSDVPMWDSAGSFGTEESWSNGWFWAGAAVVLVGVSCATDNWPCDDDDDDDYEIPDE